MYLIGDGRALTRDKDAPYYENGAVAVEGKIIVKVGEEAELKALYPRADFISAKGGVIMPGLINAHTHLYMSLSRGLEFPNYSPRTLYEGLCARSFRVDGELGFRDIGLSAYAGLIECVRNGVTTIFDHHASYKGVPGSLLTLAGAVEESGVRASLCYDTSRRCGFSPCSEAITENECFIDYCSKYNLDRIKAMFGLHSPVTLDDIDIEDCVRRNKMNAGFHIHVSEGLEDKYADYLHYGMYPVERLSKLGVLKNGSLLIHCVNVEKEEIDVIADSDVFVINTPQSNLSNAVGTADVLSMLKKGVRVGLGTDSFTYDMLETARAFVLAQRSFNRDPSIGIKEAAKLLFENNRMIAESSFGKGIGVLKEGNPADIIVMDYRPYTPFNEKTADAHIIMGMSGRDCMMTMVNGELLMLNRRLITIDERKLEGKIRPAAERLWERILEKEGSGWTPPINMINTVKQ